MKAHKRLLSLFLAIIFVFLSSVVSLAADEPNVATTKGNAYKGLMNTLEFVVDGLVNVISHVFPVPSWWEDIDDVTDEGVMSGTARFLDKPAENARFSLGYDSRSITEDFDVVGNTYVAGGIALNKKIATDIIDDSKVRTVAVSDGSGRGTTVLAVLDSYGIASPDVLEIRSRLAEFAKQNNINSINVSVLHQHSSVDAFGMNGNIFEIALVNPFRVALKKDIVNGKNKAYMEYLYNQVADSVKNAVNDMKSGSLYYGTANQIPFLRDKRAPFVCDESFNRFRFVPDNGGKETWLVSTEIHCVGNGVQGTVVTADYPYYAEQVINEKANANVMFYMGAQQSTSQERTEATVENYNPDMSRIEEMQGFGRQIGNVLTEITDEKEVSPLLNITHRQIFLPIENPILMLGGKAGMFEARIAKSGFNKYCVVSEIGYMELGDEFAFAIIPGEIAPEMVYGGYLMKDGSWSGKDWNYPSFQQMIEQKGKTRKLMVLDLANDQIGYIIPDNNYIPLVAEESDSLELVSLGRHTASSIAQEFQKTIR